MLTARHRARSHTEEDGAAKTVLTARWKTAHDMCSVVALNSAFEDCRDDDSYDLGEPHTCASREIQTETYPRRCLAASWPQPLASWSIGEAVKAMRIYRGPGNVYSARLCSRKSWKAVLRNGLMAFI